MMTQRVTDLEQHLASLVSVVPRLPGELRNASIRLFAELQGRSMIAVLGLVAGFLARALVPGDDSMGIGATILLGIVGSFVGGFLANALFEPGDQEGFGPAGFIGSVLGAIIVLLIVRAVSRGGSRGRRGLV